MIYNHERKAVWQWESGESLCPECGCRLISRKGEMVCWHWAHKAGHRSNSDCPHEESAWHLAMKFVYLEFNGWDIEVPVFAVGKKYRADAMNVTTGRIREFVHTLSPYYFQKHLDLKIGGYNVVWIADGKEFSSLRLTTTRNGGVKRLLKPKAIALHKSVGLLVHHDALLWREWNYDVWFPCRGDASNEILERLKKYDR